MSRATEHRSPRLHGAARSTLVCAWLAACPAIVRAAEPATYIVDPVHSEVRFTVRHFATNVSGRFGVFDGWIAFDAADPTRSVVSFSVRALSVDSGNSERDQHLRSADFLDTDRYPLMTFRSVAVKRVDATSLEIVGDLTIKDVTKRVTVPVSVLGVVKTPAGEKAGFEATFSIDRRDFGIVWNRVLDSGAVLGNQVKATVALEATRESQPIPVPTDAGGIQAACRAQPADVSPGGAVGISVDVISPAGAVSDAEVKVTAGSGGFGPTKSAEATGRTDIHGVFQTTWIAPSPAAPQYTLEVTATAANGSVARSACTVAVR